MDKRRDTPKEPTDVIQAFVSGAERWAAFGRQHVPIYAAILKILTAEAQAEGHFATRLAQAWREREFHTYYAGVLLVLAALRADALASGERHPLWEELVGSGSLTTDIEPARVLDAVGPDCTSFWLNVRDRRVQTNETSRAVGWLWPAFLLNCGSPRRRRLTLIDVGASAGLNLVAHRLPNIWVGPGGCPIDIVQNPAFLGRIGVDLNPLSPDESDDARWLRACIWPGDERRRLRLEQALNAWRQEAVGPARPEMRATDLTEVPDLAKTISESAPEGSLVLAFQSVVREYLSPESREQYSRGMRAWLRSTTPAAAAWIELEPARPGEPLPAAITAHLYDGTDIRSLEIARCGYHPTQIAPEPDAVELLRRMG